MLSTVQVVTPPAVEPLALDLVRRHCRIDQSDENDLLAIYLQAARVMAEAYLSRALITQTLLWTITPSSLLRPRWHFLRGVLELPRCPVQSVASVTVLDQLGNVSTIAPATLPVVPPAPLLGYKTDLAHAPARLQIGHATRLIDGRTLGSVDLENIQIQFVAGYGNAGSSVPTPIRDAILLITAFLYENRGDAGGESPRAAEWLLDPFRMMFV